MCKNFSDLSFAHFVIAGEDGTVFGCARQNGHTYNFLIRDGSVSAQTGEQWIDLEPATAEIIRNRVQQAYGRVPIYRINRLLIS